MMNKRTGSNVKKLVISAMFCALVFAATWIFVQVPIGGNVNLGDGALLLCAWMLGGPWAVVSAALGATLADLTSGFALYAPATFVIKACMVTVAMLLAKGLLRLRLPAGLARLLSAACAESVMVLGYFGYEALILSYGIGAAANIPFNLIQGAVGMAVATAMYELLVRAGFSFQWNT